MIAKVFYIFLLVINYYPLNAFEDRFCDKSYKDSLLASGGIFSIDDTLFATRRYPNTDHSIVWKFKLKVIDTKTDFKDNKFKITDMTSYEMKSLFPGLMFDYFVSGFAITDIDVDSCDHTSDPCMNTSGINNLTVILGPNQSDSRQPYAVYRYNGNTFTTVNPKVDILPLKLLEKGFTTHWFSPKAFITTAFRTKRKQIIGFNYGDKTLNKLELKKFPKHNIGNRYWTQLVSNISIQSYSYHMIELKISETERKLLLITQKMVYLLVDDKRLEEVMHPWNLFGCKSVRVLLRSGDISPKFSSQTKLELDQYEDLTTKLTISLILINLLYIGIVGSTFYSIIFYL